jgi:RNA polymerase sigma-70 factor (sigma-E family)
MDEPEGFREYVQGRRDGLLRTAFLLTGDAHLAQDLVQSVLTKVWLRWTRISRSTSIDAYVNRMMVNLHIGWRRRFWHREVPHDQLPEDSGAEDTHVDRLAMLAALGRLPPRQRAVLVLRFYQDLTEAQVAEILGCSVGTIKSQSSKALATLRRSAADLPTAEKEST